MLNRIIEFALNNRILVVSLSLLILAGGLFTLPDMDIDVFPDLTAPTVTVLCDAHGMAAEEVEALVSFPIESAMNGATHVRRVRSSSSYGFSIVWIEFDWDMDIYRARQVVSERLPVIAAQLPAGIEAPILAPQTSVMGEIMLISLRSDTLSMAELRDVADKQIRQRLLSVTGVAQVVTIGGHPKEYQVLADPFKMDYCDVSLEELRTTVRNTNKNASGGFIKQHGQEYTIRATSQTKDPLELGASVIKIRKGQPVKISDVASLRTGSPDQIGEARLNGRQAIIMTILKQPDVNTMQLTADVEAALEGLKATMPPGVEINPAIFRQADFIDTAVKNVLRVLMEGGFYVSLILFFFLLNMRTTVISLLAIPLSLLLSLITLRLLGFTINTMSLGGMAIAIGVLVDDAIIDVENVLKRLKQNHRRKPEERENTIRVIYKASVEIRSSIVQATLIIIIAFMPLFFLSGFEGRMLKPLGITFIVSLLASLVVALSLTPVLASYLLTTEKQLSRDERGRNRIVQQLNHWYTGFLRRLLPYRKAVIGVAAGLFLLTLLLFFRLGSAFLPDFHEGTLTISATTLPGVSLPQSNAMLDQVDAELMQIPEVRYVSRRTGRAELNEHSHGGSNTAEIDVPYILDHRRHADFMKEVRERLSGIAGLNLNIGQPLGHRIDHMLSGTRASIAIKLFGPDLGKMYRLANEIAKEIETIDGLVDLNVEQLVEIPQIQIQPRREMLARYGISMNQFNAFVETAIAGEVCAEVYDDNLSYPVVLRYEESFRNSLEALRNTRIDAANGPKIPLSYVADLVSSSGPNTINREKVMRKLVISANTAGRDLGSVVADIRTRIDEHVDLPPEYRIEYGGQFVNARQARSTLLITSLLAILAIFVILFQEFRSGSLAGIILLNLPLALIGGVAAVWITSATVSIPSIIGFITLYGIATRNGILLVSRYSHLRKEGLGLVDTIVQGSADRLNPILMTVLASALALIPLALAGDKPGNEIQSPMAIVILGGLVSSTLLNLLVIPSVYYMLEKGKS